MFIDAMGNLIKSKEKMSQQQKSPCSKQHALSLIPNCSECQRLLIHQSEVPFSKSVLDPFVRKGVIDRVDNQYYFIEEIQNLQNRSDDERQKALLKIKSPSFRIENVPIQEKEPVQVRHDLCQHCKNTTGLYRKCTQNYLCDECRKTPEHKILSEIQVFRQFQSLSYRDINEGIQKGVVRDLVELQSAKSITTKYFYEQDIYNLLQSLV